MAGAGGNNIVSGSVACLRLYYYIVRHVRVRVRVRARGGVCHDGATADGRLLWFKLFNLKAPNLKPTQT
jgi:hypothetical protein